MGKLAPIEAASPNDFATAKSLGIERKAGNSYKKTSNYGFELLEHSDVVFEKKANVMDLIEEHGDALYAHAEGETGKF